MPRVQTLSQFCIYTTLDEQKLDEFFEAGGNGMAIENRGWRRGQVFFASAKKYDRQMPIVFSAANHQSGLIYHAILTGVEIDDDEPSTAYAFTRLCRFDSPIPLSTLVLESNKEPLSDDRVRPYAICYTPASLNG